MNNNKETGAFTMTSSRGHTQIRLQGAEMENILTKYSLKYCKLNSVLFLLKYCEKNLTRYLSQSLCY